MFKKMLDKIKEYSIICIYRHINEDYDALGSQFGLKTMIEDNFPGKKVYAMGSIHEDYQNRMKILPDSIKDVDFSSSLAIILDTANSSRIDDNHYIAADFKIKVDHHLIVERYGDLNIEDQEASSCSEMITLFYHLNQDELTLSKKAAIFLYFGILGDTNRFMFKNSTASTLRLSATLLETGFDKEEVHQGLYLKKEDELKILNYILNNYQKYESVAYYQFSQRDLTKLGIDRQIASSYVNTLSNIQEFEVWMAITENVNENNWRVSIRSREVPIHKIAEKYQGGGHALASGATLDFIDDLDALLEDLEIAMKEYKTVN